MPLADGRYDGPLYRALNPVYARMPLSGRGAELYGGRFNPKGTAALYTALDPAGALREANRFRWRADARKVVVLVGDKPPHGGGLDGFHCCPEGIDYRDEVEELAGRAGDERLLGTGRRRLLVRRELAVDR